MHEVTTYLLTFCDGEEAHGYRETSIAVLAGQARIVRIHKCVHAINRRLRELGKTELGNLDGFMPGKPSGSPVWGAVIVDFPFLAMARLVVEQRWHLPECVRLLAQRQIERRNPEPNVLFEREGEGGLQTWTHADLCKYLNENGIAFRDPGDPFYWSNT